MNDGHDFGSEVNDYDEPAEIMQAPFGEVDGLNPDGGGIVEMYSCGVCYSMVKWSNWEYHVKWHANETHTKS